MPVAPEPEAEDFAPVGTMVLVAILAIIILGTWLILYFAVFIPRGAVS